LVELGIINQAPKGVIIPTAPLNSPFYRMYAEAHYSLVRNLYFRLRAINLLDDMERPVSERFDPDNPPVRLVARLSSDFLLRMAEPLALHIGDVVSGIVLLDLFAANTEHLPDTEGGRDDGGWSLDGFVPDELRRPVRPRILSERLGIPPETIRRHLLRLQEDGHCERREDGYVVPSRALVRPPVVRFIQDNQSHLHRLFAALADFGVLAEWEREVVALRGAA
jgi:DNA-binding transcriptional ArsR family regulator